MNMKFNKPTIIALSGVLVMILAALSVFAYNTGVLAGDPQISEEEAKQIAEELMGGTALSVELEKEGRSMVYEVVVENDDGVWEVEVDADSGEVLEVEADDGDEEDDEEDDDDDVEDDIRGEGESDDGDDDEHEDDNDDMEGEHGDDDDDENEHEFEGEEEGDN